jgi:hypothetical protein
MYAECRPSGGRDALAYPLGLVTLPGSIWSTQRRHLPAAGCVREEPARLPQILMGHSVLPLMPVIHRTILTDQGRASPRSRVEHTRPPAGRAVETGRRGLMTAWRNMNPTGTGPACAGRTGTQDHRRLAEANRDSHAIGPHRPEIFPSGGAIRPGGPGRVDRPRTTTHPEPATGHHVLSAVRPLRRVMPSGANQTSRTGGTSHSEA